MPQVFPHSIEDVRQFFRDELHGVMQRQQVVAESDSIEYLASLLIDYMKTEVFYKKGADGKPEENTLAFLYAQFVQGSPQAKVTALKRLGDICLMVAGIFPDSLKRKLVDIDYYQGMGGSAYSHLASIQFSQAGRNLFGELSKKFVAFSEVLGELGDRAGLHSNQDLIRIYEKWLLTGSDRLKKLLGEKGIVAPVKIDPKQKQ